MSKIEINYDDVGGENLDHQNALERYEDAVREAIAALGRSCWVRWVRADANDYISFRLTAYSDRNDIIAEVSALDLALDAEDFKQRIILANSWRISATPLILLCERKDQCHRRSKSSR